MSSVDNYDIDQLPKVLPLVYRLDINTFRNRRSVQLRVERILLPTRSVAGDAYEVGAD